MRNLLNWVQINDLCEIELLEIKQLVIQLCVNKWLVFNWIVSDTPQYVEPFNFVDLC